MKNILDSLNEQQQIAATHIDGALLILAGAGSGKTKTITTRLAYLINEVGIPASQTLTLTFTNKAASEMRNRALSMIGYTDQTPPLLCTFHKFGLLFLRLYMRQLDRSVDFTIIDPSDQKKIIKEISPKIKHSVALNFISNNKNFLIPPESATNILNDDYDYVKIYEKYEEYLKQNNLVDFDDLLYLTYKILETNENLAINTSERYAYIMVDEFQDTNFLQVEILKKLCCKHENLCVVGDDDQSIYSWRGSNIKYILNFNQMFKEVKTIKLESNYRSSTEILQAANKLISYNKNRLGKNLISTKGNNKPIAHFKNTDEKTEANAIALDIKKHLDSGVQLKDIAILFRINAFSRSIERVLDREKIPLKLVGIFRFYERAEIKDLIAYFRLVVNIDDDFSLSRIINSPKRGIGKVSEEKIFNTALNSRLSVRSALESGLLNGVINNKHINALKDLFSLIRDLQKELKTSGEAFINLFSKSISVVDKNDNDYEQRMANIGEFYGYFRDYLMENKNATLSDFLNDLSLDSSIESNEEGVNLMSVHASKGLEFSVVYVVGLEEKFFPIAYEESLLEEERRLCYVAFTRAKDELILSSVTSRLNKGNREFNLTESRFLFESGVSSNKNSNIESSTIVLNNIPESNQDFKINDCVNHKIFGLGMIKGIEKNRSNVFLVINFGGNIKKIDSRFVAKV